VRAGEALYFRMFERHFPELARMPWCSGGHLMAGTSKDAAYYALAARSAILEHPRVGNVLRRIGLAPALPASVAVRNAVTHANLDDPFTHADGVRRLQRDAASGTIEDTFARELVFYWSMWREVMMPDVVRPAWA
jgi:hypothetical protein